MATEHSSASEFHGRAKPSKLPLILAILMFLALVGVVAFWKGYPLVKKSRADKFASEAEALLERKAFPEAGRKLQAALQLNSNDPRYIRLGARYYAMQRHPGAFTYYQALLRSPEATDRDRYDFIELALLLNRANLAQPLIRQMLAKEPAPARSYFYASLLTEQMKDLPRAILFARSAVEKDPNERDFKYLLARMLLESTGPDDRAEGKKILMAIAAKGDDGRPQAIRLLANSEDLTAAERDQLLKWIQENKNPTYQEYFLMTEMLYRQNTNNLKQLAAQAVGKFKASKPEEQIALGAWLNRRKLFEEASLAINPEKDIKNQQLTMVYLDSLVGAEKWQDTYTFLTKRDDLSLDPILLETLRGSSAMKLKKDDLAKIHWKKAMTLAGDQMEKIRIVAEIAERSEAYDEALAGYRRLQTNAATMQNAQAAILRIKGRTGDTRGMRDYTKELLKSNKYDTALQNFNAYLNLLLNEEVAASRATVEKLHLQKPDDLGYRTTLALARLREKNSQGAYMVFGPTNYNLSTFPPGAKAIYAASLAAGGKDSEARTVAKTITVKDLKPEEAELIKSLK